MLEVAKLFRWTATTLLLIIGLTFLDGSIGMTAASSADNHDDYGLGLNINNRTLDIITHPFNSEPTIGTQSIDIKTAYHSGYNLTVSTIGNNELIGEHGGVISSDESKSDYWQVQGCGIWQSISSGQELLINYEDEAFPSDVANLAANYRVKTSLATRAGKYQLGLKYTLTARQPKQTPVVLKLSTTRHAIGSGNEQVIIKGMNLSKLDNIWVDFNKNKELDDGEECILDRNTINDKEVACQLPDVPTVLTDDQIYELRMMADNRQADTGHYMTYYYQPTIKHSSRTLIEIKPSVKIVSAVSDNDVHLVLTDDGDIYQWGSMPLHNSELDISSVGLPIKIDFPGLGDDTINSLATNNGRYFAITKKGAVYNWGNNERGYLGIGNIDNPVITPKKNLFFNRAGGIRDNIFATKLMAGDDYMVAIAHDVDKGKDGVLWTWGSNSRDQLGAVSNEALNNPGESTVPIRVDNPSNGLRKDEKYIDTTAGQYHAAATTNYGRVFTWGYYGVGEHGDGRLGWSTKENAGRPHDIMKDGDNFLRQAYHERGERFIDVAAGDDFTLALSTTGVLYSFGRNERGQLGIGNNLTSFKANDITANFNLLVDEMLVGVTADECSALAWTNNGRLFGWGEVTGSNIPQLINIPEKVKRASLGSYNFAVANSGRLYKWSKRELITDITANISHPAYTIRLAGANLEHVRDIWLDKDQNGVMNDGEQPVMRQFVNGKWQLMFSSVGLITGEYRLYVNTIGGGVDYVVIKVDEISKPPAVIEPTIEIHPSLVASGDDNVATDTDDVPDTNNDAVDPIPNDDVMDIETPDVNSGDCTSDTYNTDNTENNDNETDEDDNTNSGDNQGNQDGQNGQDNQDGQNDDINIDNKNDTIDSLTGDIDSLLDDSKDVIDEPEQTLPAYQQLEHRSRQYCQIHQ